MSHFRRRTNARTVKKRFCICWSVFVHQVFGTFQLLKNNLSLGRIHSGIRQCTLLDSCQDQKWFFWKTATSSSSFHSSYSIVDRDSAVSKVQLSQLKVNLSNLVPLLVNKNAKAKKKNFFNGWHHSSVDSSTPSILRPRVQCFYQFIFHLCHVEKTKVNKKMP